MTSLTNFCFPFDAMGSPCELQLYGRALADIEPIAAAAVAEAQRLEARYSRYRSDSLLSALNRVAAQSGSIDVDGETAGLVHYAATCHRESDGLFDITSGILRRVWRRDRTTLPDDGEIEACLAHVGWDKLRWQSPRLWFPAGMEIDLGGIVKEYAADRVAGICLAAGCRHGIVNLGGDIRIMGSHPDGEPWRIGVQHPRDRDAAVGSLALHRAGVATSGDYERCITIAGCRYGHVLNPLTGWPVRHLASVTVVGDFCMVAGSASTIAMLKEANGPAWLARLGLPHLWMDVDGNQGGSLLLERPPVPAADSGGGGAPAA